MAKFLPFIVEKSTPLHIYQTLIQRSKGMNTNLVTSILYLVADKGIIAVRKSATSLPEMPLNKLYEELLNIHSSYRISNIDFNAFQLIKDYVKFHAMDKISEELKDYSISDQLSFLLVMSYIGKLNEYTELPLERLIDGGAVESEHLLHQSKLFSSDGDVMEFASKDELASYIWFHSVIMPDKDLLPIRAVLTLEDQKQNKDRKGSSNTPPDRPTATYPPGWGPKSKKNNGRGTPPHPQPRREEPEADEYKESPSSWDEDKL